MPSAEKEPAREPASSAAAPKRLGKYELIARIGKGGMAQVYLARQRGPANFEKVVVVKTIHPHLAAKKSFIDMLLDEARIAALLKHPCVVDIYDLGVDGDTYFIAMEYLSGEPLLSVLRAGRVSKKPLDIKSTCRIISDVADGLHAAHELTDNAGHHMELVHRDVTPGNIVVLYNGQVKIVDFGIAKARGRLASETDARKLKGKLGYVAPEQVRGQAADRRADIFALGVVMWEALTYRRLFRGTKPGTVLAAIVKEPLRPPSSVRPDVPPEVDAICMRALARDPDERYATAQEMYAEIEAFLAGAGASLQRKTIGTYMSEVFAEQIAARARLLREMHESSEAAAIEPKDASAAFAPAGGSEDEDEDTADDVGADGGGQAGVAPGPAAVLPGPSVVVAADASSPPVPATGGGPPQGVMRRASSSGATGSPSGEVAAQLPSVWSMAAGEAAARRRRRLLFGSTAIGLFLIVLLTMLGGDEPRPQATTAPERGSSAAGTGGAPADVAGAAPGAEPAGSDQGAAAADATDPGDGERAAHEAKTDGAARSERAPGSRPGPVRSPKRTPRNQAGGEEEEAPGLLIHDGSEGDDAAGHDLAGITSPAPGAGAESGPDAGNAPGAGRAQTPGGGPAATGQDRAPSGARAPSGRRVEGEPRPRLAKEERKRVQTLYQEGVALFIRGEFAAAELRFREAIALAPGYAPSHRGMGLVYQATGQKRKAARAYRKYLRMAPRAADRADILSRLESLGE